MTDQQPDAEKGSDATLPITRVVETLLEKALEMRRRAADATDDDWRKFYTAGAVAYEQWSLQMQSIASLQTRIDEKTAMIKHRFPSKSRQEQAVRSGEDGGRGPADAV